MFFIYDTIHAQFERVPQGKSIYGPVGFSKFFCTAETAKIHQSYLKVQMLKSGSTVDRIIAATEPSRFQLDQCSGDHCRPISAHRR